LKPLDFFVYFASRAANKSEDSLNVTFLLKGLLFAKPHTYVAWLARLWQKVQLSVLPVP
jgi:hypothetical protein